MRAHREADRLIKGFGWKEGKGCAVGCTLEAYDHSRYPTELGIPTKIAHLEDEIFEGLPKDKAMAWPERFLSTIKPGADLSLVWPRFAIWLLADPKDGVIRFADEKGKKAIAQVVDLHRQLVAGKKPSNAARSAARDAAWAAAYRRQADKLIELLEQAPVVG